MFLTLSHFKRSASNTQLFTSGYKELWTFHPFDDLSQNVWPLAWTFFLVKIADDSENEWMTKTTLSSLSIHLSQFLVSETSRQGIIWHGVKLCKSKTSWCWYKHTWMRQPSCSRQECRSLPAPSMRDRCLSVQNNQQIHVRTLNCKHDRIKHLTDEVAA